MIFMFFFMCFNVLYKLSVVCLLKLYTVVSADKDDFDHYTYSVYSIVWLINYEYLLNYKDFTCQVLRQASHLLHQY